MIQGRICRLGYSALQREDFESFTKFRDARDEADQLIVAILDAITRLEGKTLAFPSQGEVPGKAPRPLAQPSTWLKLKRLAAWMNEGETPPPLKPGEDLSADPKLGPFLLRQSKPHRYPHLILQTDSEGYLVPLDFSEPVWLAAQSLSVASLPRLAGELKDLQKRLQGLPEKYPEEEKLLAALASISETALERSLSVRLEIPEDE